MDIAEHVGVVEIQISADVPNLKSACLGDWLLSTTRYQSLSRYQLLSMHVLLELHTLISNYQNSNAAYVIM